MRGVTITSSLLLLAACGSDAGQIGGRTETHITRDSAGIEIVESLEPEWAAGEEWKLSAEPLFIIRGYDATSEHGPLDPTSIDVDTRGRIIIGDGNQVGRDAIMVYDSLGEFLFQAGRDGRGPGEFGQLWWASAYRGDSLIAFDMARDEVTIFDPEGRFIRNVGTPRIDYTPPPRGTYGYTAGMDAAYGDGHLLAYPFGALDISSGPGMAWYTHTLLRVSPDGASWDTLGVFGINQQYWSGERQEPVYFTPIAISATGRDELYYGDGTAFEIERHDPAGRVTRLIRRAWESRPVTDADKDAFRTWYIQRAGGSGESNAQNRERVSRELLTARFAEELPPYSAVLVDDRRNLWVEEFRWLIPWEASPLATGVALSVFDSSGVWLGNVDVPAGFIVRKVTADRVLGFVVDENDVKAIHVYGLDRGR